MSGTLTIRQMRIAGVADAMRGTHDRFRAAIGRLDAARLGSTLRSALSDAAPDDQRVIVLRRLAIAVDGAEIDDPDGMARLIARGIAAAVRRLEASCPASDTIVSFDSPAAQLAAFVRIRAAGQPCDSWWLAGFDGLSALPQSSAIRAALLRDPATGLAALALMPAMDRIRPLAVLSAADTCLLLDTFAATPGEIDEEHLWRVIFALPRAPLFLSLDQAMIHALAELAGSLAPATAGGSALPILGLKIRAERSSARPAISAAVAGGAAEQLQTLLGDAPREALARLAMLPAPARAAMARGMAASPDAANEIRSGFTPFGGILMLFPHLPPLAGARLANTIGEPEGVAALLGLASLWGRAGAARAIDDPMLRATFGVDRRAGLDAFAHWMRASRLPDRPAPPVSAGDDAGLPAPLGRQRRPAAALVAIGRDALATFARKLPGFSASSLRYLHANLLDVGAQVTEEGETVRAVLERPPLDVLLSISGLADRTAPLAGGRTLVLERAR
jgi:hypothetical protein